MSTDKPDITVDDLERAVRAYHDEHGKAPVQKSGDASKYLGWPEGTESWMNVNACIGNGNRGLDSLKEFSGLHKYCIHLGLKAPDITVEGLERAVRAYHAEHGKAPSVMSGDASKYLGRPEGTESWVNVNKCIGNGYRGLESIKEFGSLHKYCIHLGLKAESPDFTVEGLERAIRAYHAEHGKAPTTKSGDASKYFGRPEWTESWDNVDQCIKAGRRGLESLKEFSSLSKYCIHLGLKNPDFTIDGLERAIRAYHDEHGKAPVQKSGDASKYFGWPEPEHWGNVDTCITTGRRGLDSIKGSSLRQFCQELGLKANKPDFTVDQVERAIRAYHAEHGKIPTRKSGDASKYFGWPEGTESWESVHQCIWFGRRGLGAIKEFGSIHKYGIHIGLKVRV